MTTEEKEYPDKVCPIDMPSVGVKKGDRVEWDNEQRMYALNCSKYSFLLPTELATEWENYDPKKTIQINS